MPARSSHDGVTTNNNHRPHTSLDGLTPKEFTTRSDQDHNQNRFYS